MNYRITFIAFSIASLLTACGEGEQPKAPEEQTAMDSAMEKAGEGADKLKEAAAEMAGIAKERSGEITAAAAAKTQELSEAAVVKAKELITQAKQYLGEGKADLAEGIVNKIQQLEGSLPESLQSQVDQLQQMLASNSPSENIGGAASADEQAPEAAVTTQPAPAEGSASGM